MFNDVGKKIKTLATVFFIFILIFAIIIAIVELILLRSVPLLWLIVLISIAFAVFCGWISYALLYGYGELIDSSRKLADNTSLLLKTFSATSPSIASKISTKSGKTTGNSDAAWVCEYCGYENPMITSFCRNCQKSRY